MAVNIALNQIFISSVLATSQRVMLAFFAVLLFAACTEGYPKEDELIINPLKLNQSEQLQAMNRLGQDAHPEMTWIYRALPSCIMQMTVDRFELGKQTFSLQMLSANVDISFNNADQVYGVQVQPRSGGSLEERPVLLSKTWVDAIEMGNLVRSFQMKCNASGSTVSHDKAN